MPKIACIIQGDLRRGSDLVVAEMSKQFDITILSTWASDLEKLPQGNYELIANVQPQHPGYTHRNFQRFTTSQGLRKARELGCTHVLKWRTDMLPTKMDVGKLLAWSAFQVPAGLSSRIVTCSFRNLTVEADFFSSIPDLFSFGAIEAMEMLWSDNGFDYTLPFNMPKAMQEHGYRQGLNLLDVYGPESELYAIYRSRLEEKLGIPLDHRWIVSQSMYLFDVHKLGICWFGKDRGFRSIVQALQFPWWSVQNWRRASAPVVPLGYVGTGLRNNFLKWLSTWNARLAQLRQCYWLWRYKSIQQHN